MNAWRTRCLVALCALWMSAAPGARALAQAPPAGSPAQDARSFLPVDTAWTGLSDLVALAGELGISLDLEQDLDWSRVEQSDVLVLVHPVGPLETEDALRFVAGGGRMLLALEPGDSSPFLERLGLELRALGPEQTAGAPAVRDNPALPIFSPTGDHPLLDSVQTLVANHPGVLVNIGGPVVPYPDGSGLVYDMNLSKGKVVVFADASLLINQMLQVADNARLARNALEYLCAERQPCRVRLRAGDFSQFGTFSLDESDDSSATDSLSRWLSEINATLRKFMHDMPATRLLYYLAVMLAGGLALYLGAVFRLRAGRPFSEHIELRGGHAPTPQSEYDWNLERFGKGGRETNFVLPLAILKEVFEELFLDALGFWPIPKDRPTVAQLGAAFRQRYLTQARDAERVERQVVDLLATFALIPTRHRVFLDNDAYFSERDLIRIYRSTRQVLQRMGLEEAYERRTRNLV